MRRDPRADIQATLETLLAQTDEAITRADAAVGAALKRGDVGAARRALNSVHDCGEFRDRVLYVTNGWTQLQLPPEDRTFARIARIARGQKDR